MHIEGRIDKPSLSHESVIDRLQALFERWTPEGIAEGRNINESPIVLSKESAEQADALWQSAMLFILAHEFGHVTYYKTPEDAGPAPALTREQEFEADKTGYLHLVAKGPGSQRMRCAGGVVALRVLAVFGSLGHKFPPGHPQPLERLGALMTALRESSANEHVYWHVTPIAYSFDEMLETAGIHAAKTGKHAPLTADRMFSRLSAVLEQCVRDGRKASFAAGVMRFDCNRAPKEMLDEVAQTASRVLRPVPGPVSSDFDQWQNEKASLYRSIFRELPEPASTIFRIAYKKVPPEKG